MSSAKTKRPQGSVAVRTKSVVAKIKPNVATPLDFQSEKGVDAFVVSVTGPGFKTQVTFHRPIGHSDLPGDAWVCTSTPEVNNLILRKDNPYLPEVTARREKYLLGAALAAGLLKKKDSEDAFRYPKSGDDRSKALQEANKADKKAADEAKKANAPYSLTALNYLSESNREDEKAYRDFKRSQEVHKVVSDLYPIPHYETCSGAFSQNRQEKSWLEGKTSVQAMMNLVAGISQPQDSFRTNVLDGIEKQVKAQLSTFPEEDSEEKFSLTETLKQTTATKRAIGNLSKWVGKTKSQPISATPTASK